MRIEHIDLARNGSKARLSADITWEDSDRPAQQIYFEVEDPFSQSLTRTPHAFLVPAVIPAMRHGEKRVFVDEPICPDLWDGLEVAMAWIHEWHGDSQKPVVIEAQGQSSSVSTRPPERAGCFFTGGIDSMATLRRNRLRIPASHPSPIKDGVIIFGLEVDKLAAFDEVLKALAPVAADANFELLPIHTNVRTLDLDWQFWEFEWEGSVYSGVAHALSNRLTLTSIGATYDVPNMDRLGSHPLLDHNYSSSTLRIRHDGLTLSRLEKTRLLADWPAGLQHLRVCNTVDKYQPETINCGQCEKCVRTMLALAALGVLDKTRAFPAASLTPHLVLRVVKIYSPYMEACYEELVDPLRVAGRQDLANSVQWLLERVRDQVGWRASFRRFDSKYFGGRLRMVKYFIVPPPFLPGILD
jgi:hypothetical protein